MSARYPAAVFFDAYGTLIHFPEMPSPFEYMADAMRRAGFCVPRECLDHALRVEMDYFKSRYGTVRTPSALDRLRAEGADIYLGVLGDVGEVKIDRAHVANDLVEAFRPRVLPDALPAIEAVRAAGVRVGVLSNFSYALSMTLDELGLQRLLDPIVVSAQVGFEKPDPRIFFAAAHAVGVEPSDCVLVGDDLINDIHGAQGVGMPSVWIVRDSADGPASVSIARNLVDAAHMAIGRGWWTLSVKADVSG